MYCNCGNIVETPRAELGLESCRACAFAGPDLRPKGRMIYSHKTGGEIEILSHNSWQENRARFQANGARSAVKNFSKHICS
jgi:hypothetical protein